MIKTNEYPELLNLDPATRVYVFCAAGSGLGRQHVLFPEKCEIKVNGTENRRSLRGIGKRPGTSRPLDITDMLRLKLPKYENDVELARQFLDGFLSGAFDKHDSVIELVFVKSSSRGCNHLRVELQSDDFSFGSFSCFVPRKRAVTSVAADFEDWACALE